MRREALEYRAQLRGASRHLHGALDHLDWLLVEYLWRRATSRIKVGSPLWQEIHHRLGLRSSTERNMVRRRVFLEATMRSSLHDLREYPMVQINYPWNLTLSPRVVLNRGVFVHAVAPVEIGVGALIGPYVVINSGNHRYSDRTRAIRGQGHDCEPIVIADDVWVGAGATILKGVTIGEGAVVAAGAVVTNNVDPFTIVGGIPAHQIGVR
jgi:acetyltransferase-like isoleucine patch superfamily enzyme